MITDPKGNLTEYVVGIDPYQRLTRWQRVLRFFSLYKQNRSGAVSMLFKRHKDGTVEYLPYNKHK